MIVTEEKFLTSRSYDYHDIKRGLLELQPGLVFDEGTGECFYMFNADGNMRAGIYYNGAFIAAIERGNIPEYDIYDGKGRYEVPCSIQDVIDDPSGESYFIEVSVKKTIKPVEHWTLDAWIGLDGSKVIRNPQGAEVFLLREADGSITISTAFKIVELPCRVLRIGWRSVFERLMNAAVPGCTKERLQQKFKVDLLGPDRSDLMIVTATAGLPRMGA